MLCIHVLALLKKAGNLRRGKVENCQAIFCMVCKIIMTFCNILTVFQAWTTVLCLLQRGLEIFSFASEGLTKSHAENVQKIYKTYSSCCHFCCTTFLRRKWNPFDPITDLSDQCIGIVLLLIDWHHLFRRCYPPKNELDIQDLQGQSLGHGRPPAHTKDHLSISRDNV
jgi:hypothetical protein